jgi:CARDB
MKTLLRVIVIGAILLILVFLSIGIVKIVPKALSSLASATVSIGSIFDGGENATSTNGANGTVIPNGNGFIVVSSSTQNGATSSGNSPWATGGTNGKATTSLLDLITPKFGTYPSNNYVPTPAGQPTNKEILEAEKKALAEKAGTSGSNSAYTNTSNTSRACVAGEQPDLAVSILSRGIISKTTGQYIETNNFTTSDTVSLKFKVENRGLCNTGSWNFKAEMPSNNATDQVRTVSNAGAIPAGRAVTGQANFDSPRSGSSNVVFTVTDNSGRDGNTSNNTATSALVVTNSGTGTGGNNGGVITSGDGRADLSVRILQTGILSYNNQFVPASTINGTNGAFGGNFRTNDRVAVQFEITNQGRSASGMWNFRAELTGNGYPAKNYENPQYESSIPAGGRAVYTIAFDNIQIGSNTITIFLDHLNQVNEFNEGNNIGSVGFNVNY